MYVVFKVKSVLLFTEPKVRARRYSTSWFFWICNNRTLANLTVRRREWATVRTRFSYASCPAYPFAMISCGSCACRPAATSGAFHRPHRPPPRRSPAIWSTYRSTYSSASHPRYCWWKWPWPMICTGLPFDMNTHARRLYAANKHGITARWRVRPMLA